MSKKTNERLELKNGLRCTEETLKKLGEKTYSSDIHFLSREAYQERLRIKNLTVAKNGV